MARGRTREDQAQILEACEFNPISSFVNVNGGWMLYTGRRFSDALAHLRKACT